MDVPPFKVYNPVAGRWFVLYWWTDEDRGHLAFASSPDNLRAMACKVFEENPFAEVKAVLEIEVVAPSHEMCRIAAEWDRRDRADQFYYEVAQKVKDAWEAGKVVPGPFRKCQIFEAEDPENAVDEWAGERHYGCKNCDMRISMAMSRVEFYEKYYDRWRAANPKTEYSRNKGVPSLAAPASDGEEGLRYAHANFGDHAGGVELREVDLSDASECRPLCLWDSTLLFFRQLGEPAKLGKEIGALRARALSAFKKTRKAEEAARKRERTREEKAEVASTVKFFSGSDSV